MRMKDKILTDMTINNDRGVIAKNKSNHIIKLAPASKPNFDKKAKRIEQINLNNVINWIERKYA